MADGPENLNVEQRQFLTGVLGISLPAGLPDAPRPPVVPIWTDATDTAGEQIGALQGFLKGSGLPLFEKIADSGLHGITSGEFTKMRAALFDYDKAPGDTTAAGVITAIGAMRGFLGGNNAVALLERNPFGVTVTLQSTLGSAMDRIERIVG